MPNCEDSIIIKIKVKFNKEKQRILIIKWVINYKDCNNKTIIFR